MTHLAQFQSSESVNAAVDADGRVKAGPIPGEAAIMARFVEKFAVCNVLIPLPATSPPSVYAKLPRNNFIDGLVWAKLKQLGITPSEPAGDATFHRRAFLDVIGRLPTPDETRAFLADKDPEQAREARSTRCWSGPSTPTSGRTSGPTCCGRTRTASASRRPTTSTTGCAKSFRAEQALRPVRPRDHHRQGQHVHATAPR